jgi:hypothetical protein
MRLARLGLACAVLALFQPVYGTAQENPRPRAPNIQKGITGADSTAALADAKPAPLPVVQDYEPRPALWKLADDYTTIYLFGTFHILPAKFRWRTELFDRTIREVDELVVETSDADSDAGMEAFGSAIAQNMAVRAPTSERLSPANVAKWRQLARLSDLPYQAFDRMPVLFAMIASGLSVARMQGSEHDLGVESVLEAEFAKAEKPVRSIEDSAAVLRTLLAIEEDGLIAELEGDLSKWDGVSADSLFLDTTAEKPVPFAEEHRWARGLELEAMFTAEELAKPVMKAMYDVLLTDRNTAWAAWLDDRLDRPGTLLVAVGAGHFEGEDSVLVKLAERGFVAQRIQ